MRRDLTGVFVAMADLLLCFLVIVITMVALKKPVEADAPKPKAEFLITADWSTKIDGDVDLWVMTPNGKPVFYASSTVGCAVLNHDSRGFLDGIVTLADGSKATVDSYKETVTIRCMESGHYDVAVNLFKDNQEGEPDIKVHVEIVRLNPSVTTEWSGDVTLDRVGQTINVESFDLAADGKLTLADPPLRLVTAGAIKPVGNPMNAPWLGFVGELGGLFAASAVMVAWIFRSTGAPFALKLVLPAAAVALACWTPFQVGAMMGFPVVTSLSALPDQVQLVAFLPHDEAKTVVLWLMSGPEPRAYEVELTKGLKETLRQAAEQLAQGRPVSLRKGKGGAGKDGKAGGQGKDGHAGAPSVTDLSDAYDPGYSIDESVLSTLPAKE